jgi:uncharacterized protein YfaS (alpha-2-macroglobulin family)
MDALLSYVQQTLSGNDKPSRDELTERAYACYVMARAGRKVQQRMEQLYDGREKLSNEGRALLAGAYLQAGLPDEARALLQLKPLSNVDATSISRQSGGILASPIRETALLLLTWTDLDIDAPETADLATRLMNLRHDGHWGTTQDNGFALLSLGRYAQKITNSEPTRGTLRVGGKSYDFSTSEPISLARAELAGAQGEITCAAGTAYITYLAEGVPLAPPGEAVANGVSLERRYLDRNGDPLDPQSLIQGQLVVVELTVGGNRSLDNVVVQDLLPAGLEIENPRLESAETIEADDENSGFTVDRMDVRDDRMLLFASLHKVAKGPQKFRYTTRAVTPGEYVQPPAMLEAMYDPRVQARTQPGRVVIEKRTTE